MGIHIIKMPDIGEGIAEVELVAWHVQVGDMVAEDQILADVMTDKATVEIPSSVAGKVLALGGALRVSQVQLIQPFLALLLAVPVLGEALKPSTLAFSLAVMAVVMLGKRMPVRATKESTA